MIRFACPRCARPFKSSPSMVGRLTRCPACGAEFHVPHDPRQTALHAEPEEAVPVVRPVAVRKPRRNDYPLIACGVALFLLLAAALFGIAVALFRQLHASPYWPGSP